MKPLLGSWRNEAARDNAMLLLSEIVSNAVRHAHGETILITVAAMDHHLRAEVHDESASLPIPRPSDETGGLGLKLIDQLSDQWGSTSTKATGRPSGWRWTIPIPTSATRTPREVALVSGCGCCAA